MRAQIRVQIPDWFLAASGWAPTRNPSAGEWPPLPGMNAMTAPAINPPTIKSGSGHHAGTTSNPSAMGSPSKSHWWPWLTAHKK